MAFYTDFKDIVGVTSGEKANMLGQFLYFSLANILIDKEKLLEICENTDIPYSGGKCVSVSDAFRSATGDIKDRLVTKAAGKQRIYHVYCRNNEHGSGRRTLAKTNKRNSK